MPCFALETARLPCKAAWLVGDAPPDAAALAAVGGRSVRSCARSRPRSAKPTPTSRWRRRCRSPTTALGCAISVKAPTTSCSAGVTRHAAGVLERAGALGGRARRAAPACEPSWMPPERACASSCRRPWPRTSAASLPLACSRPRRCPGLDENDALTTRSFDVGQIGLPDVLLIRREILETRFPIPVRLTGGRPGSRRRRRSRRGAAMTMCERDRRLWMPGARRLRS